MTRSSSSVNIEAIPTALVLGGSNFLGSHLCDSLIAHGCRVICVDDPDQWGRINIAHLEGNKNFQLIDPAATASYQKISFDYAFGLESKYFGLVPDLIVRRWLLFSPNPNPALLSLVKDKRFNLRLACAQQVFGPRMDVRGSSFIARLVNRIFFNKKVVLPGDGSVKIYPLFVKDLIRGLTAAIFMPQSRQQIFYFAGEEITAFSFVKIWTDCYRPDLEIVFDPEAEPPRLDYLAVLPKTRTELDWKATTPLTTAVESTVTWLKRPDVIQAFSSKSVPSRRQRHHRESIVKKGKKRHPVVERRDFFDLTRLYDKDREEEPEERGAEEGGIRNTGLEDSKPPRSEKAPKQKKRKRLLLMGLVFLLIFWGIFSPFLFLAGSVFLGVNNLERAQESLQQDNFKRGSDQAMRARNYFVRAEKASDKLSFPLGLILGDENSLVLNRYLTLGIGVSSVISSGSAVGQKMALISQAVMSGKDEDCSGLLDESSSLLERAYFNLADVQAISRGLKVPSRYSSLLSELPTTINDLELTIKALPLLKNFLAKKRQTLLVLFQNNMELRPTGGFIGSYGLLTFNSGQLIDFNVYDVYDADGQLHGHVEPPAAIKRYLGETGWYLRDSNWSPDFPVSARQAAWFFDKEMKRQVDGVIAVNLRTIRRLLAATGKIYLPDYDETVDSRNLFERTEYHSEVGFFPGSTQKKDFLAAVSFAMMERLRKGAVPWLSTMKALEQSLANKDILVYFNDPQLEGVVDKLNFDGGIKEARCQGKNCLTDYLLLVDANVGANKANFFVRRQLVQHLALSNRGLVHSVRLSYQNTAQSETWPGGRYKNYWRAFLPANAVVESVYLEDQQGKRRKVDDWDEGKEAGKKVVGVLISVPIQAKLTIELTYRINVNFAKANKKQLAFLCQKQGGADFDEDIVFISYPLDWLPLSVSPAAAASPGTITYHDFLKRGDRLLQIEWGQ